MRKILITHPSTIMINGKTAIQGRLVFGKRKLEDAVAEDGFAMIKVSLVDNKREMMAPVIVSDTEPLLEGDMAFYTDTQELVRWPGTIATDVVIPKVKKVIVEPSGFSQSQLSKLGNKEMDENSIVYVGICFHKDEESHVSVDNDERVTLYLQNHKETKNSHSILDSILEKQEPGGFKDFLQKLKDGMETKTPDPSSTNSPMGSYHHVNTLMARVYNIGLFMCNAKTSQIEEHAKGHGQSLSEAAQEMIEARKTVLMTKEEWEEKYLAKFMSNQKEAEKWKFVAQKQQDLLKNVLKEIGHEDALDLLNMFGVLFN